MVKVNEKVDKMIEAHFSKRSSKTKKLLINKRLQQNVGSSINKWIVTFDNGDIREYNITPGDLWFALPQDLLHDMEFEIRVGSKKINLELKY